MSSGIAYEWIAFEGDLPAHAGARVVLHHAPGRWLLLGPDEHCLRELRAVEAAGTGALIEVSARWEPIEWPQTHMTLADHPLNAAAPLDLVLQGRDVASLWMFDCPVLLTRSGVHIGVWVEASYASSFRAMLARL
jgi:hypothetical protein